MMPGIRIILGMLVLLLGRRLYWIMVGVGGLLAGMEFTQQVLAEWAPSARFLLAIVAGGVGVLLAILAQRVAFALLGFFGGGFIALVLTQSMGSDNAQLAWFILGALAGAIIAALVMDWAIIVLTSLAGAAAIVTSFAAEPAFKTALFVIVAGVGIAIQSRGLTRGTQKADARFESFTPGERKP